VVLDSQLERWRYDIRMADQPKLRSLLEALERLRSCGLMAAVVVAAFHHWRVLPLMARQRRLFNMRPDEPIEGIRMSAAALSNEEILCRVRETVEGKLKNSGLTPIMMRPSQGYLFMVSHMPL